MRVIVIATEAMQMISEGSQPIFSRSFWSYPPKPIIRGTVAVAEGVRNAVSEAALRRISGPTGLAPSALHVRMMIGTKMGGARNGSLF